MPAKRRRYPRRKNPPGNTTRVGLGTEHQSIRKVLMAAYIDGDPCYRCHRPMRHWQKLNADHKIPRALGGTTTLANMALSHASCDAAAGARLGNDLRSARRKSQAARTAQRLGITTVIPATRRRASRW